MGVPTAVHEQNAFPGVTNKLLAKQVDKVMVTTKAAEEYFNAKNPVTVTGLPVKFTSVRRDLITDKLSEKIKEILPVDPIKYGDWL